MTANCPTCGAPLAETPRKFLADVRLSASQRRIVDMLADAYPRSVAVDSVIDMLYADDPEGGPDYATQVLRTHLTRIRAAIEPLGWTVPRKEHYGYYRLARLSVLPNDGADK